MFRHCAEPKRGHSARALRGSAPDAIFGSDFCFLTQLGAGGSLAPGTTLSPSLSPTLFSLCADSASKKLCFPGNTNIREHGWQTFLLLSSSFRALICTKHEKYRARLQCNYSYLKGQQVFWICYHGISNRFLRAFPQGEEEGVLVVE
jgi:hypothetical protein